MNSLFKTVVFLVIMFLLVLGCATLFGYSCMSSNHIDDFSKTPCVPVLSNGKTNPHYQNNWNNCTRNCIGKRANLDINTCKCECK